jgi:hypothetical protein
MEHPNTDIFSYGDGDCVGETIATLTRGRMRIEFANIGEGWDGDYNPDDPEDDNLLRFYVQFKTNGAWEDVDSASYCTQTPVDTPEPVLHALLTLMMDRIYDGAAQFAGDLHLKRPCEELSWIEPRWVDRAA